MGDQDACMRGVSGRGGPSTNGCNDLQCKQKLLRIAAAAVGTPAAAAVAAAAASRSSSRAPSPPHLPGGAHPLGAQHQPLHGLQEGGQDRAGQSLLVTGEQSRIAGELLCQALMDLPVGRPHSCLTASSASLRRQHRRQTSCHAQPQPKRTAMIASSARPASQPL